MLSQFREAAHDEQTLRFRSWIDFLMLKNPGVAVGYKYGVQSDCKRGIDIRLRTVADHPGYLWNEGMFFNQGLVCSQVFLGNNLGLAKEGFQSRALDFSGLLRNVAFGH